MASFQSGEIIPTYQNGDDYLHPHYSYTLPSSNFNEVRAQNVIQSNNFQGIFNNDSHNTHINESSMDLSHLPKVSTPTLASSSSAQFPIENINMNLNLNSKINNLLESEKNNFMNALNNQTGGDISTCNNREEYRVPLMFDQTPQLLVNNVYPLQKQIQSLPISNGIASVTTDILQIHNHHSYQQYDDKLMEPAAPLVSSNAISFSVAPNSNILGAGNNNYDYNPVKLNHPQASLAYSTGSSVVSLSSSASSSIEDDDEARSHSISSSANVPQLSSDASGEASGRSSSASVETPVLASILKTHTKKRRNKVSKPRPSRSRNKTVQLNTPCPYEGCKYEGIFATKEYLRRHIREQHTQQKSHYCAGILSDGRTWGCGRGFKRPYQLVYHWRGERSLKKCAVPTNILEEAKIGGLNAKEE